MSGSVRLIGPEPVGSGDLGPSQGDMEVCFNNEWTPWCFSGWDDVDAGVVCRQLGFTAPGQFLVDGVWYSHSGIRPASREQPSSPLNGTGIIKSPLYIVANFPGPIGRPQGFP